MDESQNIPEVEPVEQPEVAQPVVEVVADGTILNGTDGQEKIVHDLDEAGNIIGWHKEVI